MIVLTEWYSLKTLEQIHPDCIDLSSCKKYRGLCVGVTLLSSFALNNSSLGNFNQIPGSQQVVGENEFTQNWLVHRDRSSKRL